MPVTYSAPLRSLRMQRVIDAVDGADNGGGSGTLEILSANGLSLVVVELDRPSFTEADGILTLVAPISGLADNTGLATAARFTDPDGDAVISA